MIYIATIVTQKKKKEVSHPLIQPKNLIVSQTLTDLTKKAEHLTLSQSELKNYLPSATNSWQTLPVPFYFFMKKQH